MRLFMLICDGISQAAELFSQDRKHPSSCRCWPYASYAVIHHDPELWGDDVEEFRPERFLGGVSRASKDQLALFPFGWSPRTCIGRNFAMLEAKMALAMILQNFEFNLSPSYIHAPHTVMILQPQHGAQIIIHQLWVVNSFKGVVFAALQNRSFFLSCCGVVIFPHADFYK